MPTNVALLGVYLKDLSRQYSWNYQTGGVGAVMCYCLKWSGAMPDLSVMTLRQDHKFCDLADFFVAGREVEQQDV